MFGHRVSAIAPLCFACYYFYFRIIYQSISIAFTNHESCYRAIEMIYFTFILLRSLLRLFQGEGMFNGVFVFLVFNGTIFNEINRYLL